MKKINTYIFTGFLGAGKTTVLNSILRQVSTQRNIIVENEFGKINIDKQLIEQKYDQLYELTNGCICCTYDEGFFDLLTELYPRRNEIDNLFIETTGIADVSPIISIFEREDVKQHFSLINTICIADAEVVENNLQEFVEVEKQIVHSDILIINKSGYVDADYLSQLTVGLQERNPLAKIIYTEDGSIKFEQISESKNEAKLPIVVNSSDKKRHSNLKTHLYETDEPIDVMKFRYIMNVTMLLYSHQIYRTKGFVKSNDGKTYLFQSAGKSTSISIVEDENYKKTQLVFIGKDVEYSSIERLMKQTFYKLVS